MEKNYTYIYNFWNNGIFIHELEHNCRTVEKSFFLIIHFYDF